MSNRVSKDINVCKSRILKFRKELSLPLLSAADVADCPSPLHPVLCIFLLYIPTCMSFLIKSTNLFFCLPLLPVFVSLHCPCHLCSLQSHQSSTLPLIYALNDFHCLFSSGDLFASPGSPQPASTLTTLYRSQCHLRIS